MDEGKKLKVRKRRVKASENIIPKIVKLDKEQMQEILNSLQNMIDDNSKETSESIMATVDRKDDFISHFIRMVIFSIFILVGLILIIGVIGGWSTYFVDSKTRFFGVIIILYAIFFFIASVDIIKEKNRQYIVSLFSSLVSLVALIIAYIALKN